MTEALPPPGRRRLPPAPTRQRPPGAPAMSIRPRARGGEGLGGPWSPTGSRLDRCGGGGRPGAVTRSHGGRPARGGPGVPRLRPSTTRASPTTGCPASSPSWSRASATTACTCSCTTSPPGGPRLHAGADRAPDGTPIRARSSARRTLGATEPSSASPRVPDQLVRRTESFLLYTPAWGGDGCNRPRPTTAAGPRGLRPRGREDATQRRRN